MKTFESWMRRHFDRGQLSDMVKHGVQGGFPGLIYYSETTALYRKFQDEIWENLYEDSTDYGCNILELINNMNGTVDSSDTFENLLVWYMAEKTANNILMSR
jgi:hypothetical protein